MTATTLDHVNIATHDLPASAAFYSAVLDLRCDSGPPGMSADNVQWLYDANDRPIVHLNSPEVMAGTIRQAEPGQHTGAIHHVAFNCVGHAGALARLDAMRIDYEQREVASIGLRQVFLTDPCGVLLEMNFYGD